MKTIFVTAVAFSVLLGFGMTFPETAEAGSRLVECAGQGPFDCKFEDLVKTGETILEFLVQLGTVIAVIVISYAGFMYMTAGDNSGKVKKAHELIWYTTIGFLIVISAWLLVRVLLNTLEVKEEFKPNDSGRIGSSL
jgi:amino acid transporter